MHCTELGSQSQGNSSCCAAPDFSLIPTAQRSSAQSIPMTPVNALPSCANSMEYRRNHIAMHLIDSSSKIGLLVQISLSNYAICALEARILSDS